MAENKQPLKLVEPGKYLATVHDIALTKSGEKGTRQLEAIFRINQPGTEFHERGVGYRGYFSEATVVKTLEGLEHMGLADPADNLDAIGKHWKPAKDHMVQIVVEHEEGEVEDKETKQKVKKKFARVRWVNSAGGATIKAENKLDEAEANDFAREISALYGKGKGGSKRPAPAKTESAPRAKTAPKAAEPAALPADDDIPF